MNLQQYRTIEEGPKRRRYEAFEILKILIANTPNFGSDEPEAKEVVGGDVAMAYAYVDELDRQGGIEP